MPLRGFDTWTGVQGAESLVRYIEGHAETPRALCLCGHILALYYLAGWGVAVVQPGQPSPMRPRSVSVSSRDIDTFESLHSVEDLAMLVDSARTRIAHGFVPEDWVTNFHKAVGVPS